MAGAGAGGAGALSAGSGGISVIGAVASALNAVDLEYSDVMKQTNPASETDALRPGAYTLTALVPSTAIVRLSQAVETLGDSLVRVLFDGPIPPALFEIEVAPEVESVLGVSMEPNSRTAEFTGLALIRAERGTPVTPRIGNDLRNTSTLSLDGAGDLDVECGVEALRKRIVRRATTFLGGFFHLPEYGFAEGLKVPITTDLLRRLQSRALAQVRQEPDVLTSSVRVERASTHVVTLTITATTRYADCRAVIQVDTETGEVS